MLVQYVRCFPHPLITYPPSPISLLPIFLLSVPYTAATVAAVPSKRDMQTLIRSVQTELGMAAAEGDKQGGLLRAVCKEAVKAVQLVSTLRYRLLCVVMYVFMCGCVLGCLQWWMLWIYQYMNTYMNIYTCIT